MNLVKYAHYDFIQNMISILELVSPVFFLEMLLFSQKHVYIFKRCVLLLQAK